MTPDTRRRPNVWLGAVGLAFVVACLYETTNINAPGGGSDPGPAAYPQLILAMTGLCALGIMVSRPDGSGEEDQRRSWPVVAGIVGSLVVYLFCLQFIGYIVSTVIFLVLLLVLAGERRWVVGALYAVLVSCCLYFVFSTYLSVSLPIGLIEELLQ